MELIIDTEHSDLYANHSAAYAGDSGVDLFFPKGVVVKAKSSVLIDLEVKCEILCSGKNLGYYMYPRSSISKTPLRMSNSVGIIDAMYRHTLKVAVDNISDSDYYIYRGERLFQICNAQLSPMEVTLKKTEPTTRGEGFGSSNSNPPGLGDVRLP